MNAGVLFRLVIGLTIALVFSALLTLPLSHLPGLYGEFSPLAVTVLLCGLGMWIMAIRGEELLELLGLRLPAYSKLGKRVASQNGQVLVDTSSIIDGRIADIGHTGFISGPLLIPGFVLNELQGIADSSDTLRRNRGRRGLEMLNRLQQEAEVPIQILDMDIEDIEEVDAKLIKLATILRCPIITNDFNLNRVAKLQGVKVFNINELANALKPAVLPGEEINLRIIQEGKEIGQGVGFLDDGTMVVVEGGQRHLDNCVDIVITRVLQTVAGRMVFAHLKNGETHDRANKE